MQSEKTTKSIKAQPKQVFQRVFLQISEQPKGKLN